MKRRHGESVKEEDLVSRICDLMGSTNVATKTGKIKVVLQCRQDVYYKCWQDGEKIAVGIAAQDRGTLGLYSGTAVNRPKEALERPQWKKTWVTVRALCIPNPLTHSCRASQWLFFPPDIHMLESSLTGETKSKKTLLNLYIKAANLPHWWQG